MNPSRARAQSLLPLTPAVFHILLALADADRHGYGIAKEVSERTAGSVRLGPGTLYGTLLRMVEADLILERGDRDANERRRYYRLTPFGRTVAKLEAERLADLVTVARAKSLLRTDR